MIESNKLPHAILFSGGTFEQKAEHVFNLAKKLLSNQTWDLLVLPEEKEDSIKIDDIRRVTHHLTQTTHQGGNKVVILLKADSMPIGASNALLKILEEPPQNSYLFLISEYPHFLSATLRSRCQKVNFPAQKKEVPDVENILKAIKNNTLSIFDAAEKLKEHNLIDVLDSLYYFCIEHFISSSWVDLINHTRKQILNKQNPNHLLTLEHLFYQWKKLT